MWRLLWKILLVPQEEAVDFPHAASGSLVAGVRQGFVLTSGLLLVFVEEHRVDELDRVGDDGREGVGATIGGAAGAAWGTFSLILVGRSPAVA